MIWTQSCDGDELLSDIDETYITYVAQLSFPFGTRYLENIYSQSCTPYHMFCTLASSYSLSSMRQVTRNPCNGMCNTEKLEQPGHELI